MSEGDCQQWQCHSCLEFGSGGQIGNETVLGIGRMVGLVVMSGTVGPSFYFLFSLSLLLRSGTNGRNCSLPKGDTLKKKETQIHK